MVSSYIIFYTDVEGTRMKSISQESEMEALDVIRTLDREGCEISKVFLLTIDGTLYKCNVVFDKKLKLDTEIVFKGGLYV